MDIPIQTKVNCTDGSCGHSVCVVINPVAEQLTHLVVKEKDFPYLERIVPIELVAECSPQLICLNCTKSQLAILKPFFEVEYKTGDGLYFGYEVDEYRMWPYATSEVMPIPAELERISPEEVRIYPGARVKAKDGRVGQVNEFLIDPTNGHITHLVLRDGHLWSKKDVTIPVSDIERIEKNVVYLKLDKHSIEKLPSIPVRRMN